MKTNINPAQYQSEIDKLISFRKLLNSGYLVEIPSELAIDSSLCILNNFISKKLLPEKISPMVEGGIIFEFFTGDGYHSISVYNDSEIIYLKRSNDKTEHVINNLTASSVGEYIYV
jgi:hypothetical protein